MEGSSACMEAYNSMSEANSFVRIHGVSHGISGTTAGSPLSSI